MYCLLSDVQDVIGIQWEFAFREMRETDASNVNWTKQIVLYSQLFAVLAFFSSLDYEIILTDTIKYPLE